MRRKQVVAALAVVTALALSACGGGSKSSGDKNSDQASATTAAASASGTQTSATIDPCTLLTQAELAAAFGGTEFGAGEKTDHSDKPQGGSQCTWASTSETPAKTFSVSFVSDATIAESLRKAGQTASKLYYDSASLAKQGSDYELISGLGDQAFRSGSRLVVLRGDVQLSFMTLLGTSDEAIAGMKQLATTAVARLGS